MSNIFLPKSNKLDIVIAKWLYILLVQILLVVSNKILYPLAIILTRNTIWWIAYHHHYGIVALDDVSFRCLTAQPLGKEGAWFFVALFERVGEIDMQTFVGLMLIASFCQQHVELDVGDGIRSHQNLESIQSGQQVLLHILLPNALLVAIAVVYLVDHLG